MVDCAGLENRRAERFRGFESHLLRHQSAKRILKSEGGMMNAVRAPRSGTDCAKRSPAGVEDQRCVWLLFQ